MVWLQVCARVLLTGRVVIAAAALADRWLAPDGMSLLLLAIVAMLAAGSAALYLAWPHHRAPDDLRVARFVEERCPELDDAIATAVALDRGPEGATLNGFGPLVVGRALAAVRDLDPSRIVSAERLRGSVFRVCLTSASLIAACWFAMPLATHVVEVARLRFFPASVAISVQPGNVRLAAGRPLRIAARLQGGAAALTHVAPMLSVDSNGQRRTVRDGSRAGRQLCRRHQSSRSFVRVSGQRRDARSHRPIRSPHSCRRTCSASIFATSIRRSPVLAAHEQRDGGDVFAPLARACGSGS